MAESQTGYYFIAVFDIAVFDDGDWTAQITFSTSAGCVGVILSQ
jgi:hypothetical protein